MSAAAGLQGDITEGHHGRASGHTARPRSVDTRARRPLEAPRSPRARPGRAGGAPRPGSRRPVSCRPRGAGPSARGPAGCWLAFLVAMGISAPHTSNSCSRGRSGTMVGVGAPGLEGSSQGPCAPSAFGCPCPPAPQGGVPPRVLAPPEKHRVCSGRPSAVQSSARGGVWAARGAGLWPPCHPRARPGLLPGSPSLSPAAGGGPRQGACKWVQTPLIQGTPPRFAIVTPTGLYEFLKL